MIYKESSVSIMERVHAALEFPVKIKSVTAIDATTHRLHVCDIYHVQIGFTVTIGGNDYTVVDFSFDDSAITVSGDATIVATSFELYHPFFFHGTLAATDVELSQEINASNKTPMVWMRELPVKDKFSTSTETSIDREMRDSSIFFLSQSDQNGWQTEEAYQKVVMPMRRLQENFLKKMQEMIAIFNLINWEYDVINYSKMAVYASGKSSGKAFFVDNLAGCEMPLSGLKIWKGPECEEYC